MTPFTLRPALPSDYDWLWKLKQRTMRAYVEKTWGTWDEAGQEAFFRRAFRCAFLQIILVDGRDAGLLEIEHRPGELYLANIQIHPDFQHRGLGSAVVRSLIADAQTRRTYVRLQVLKANPDARRFYERLGFVAVAETTTHIRMRGPGP